MKARPLRFAALDFLDGAGFGVRTGGIRAKAPCCLDPSVSDHRGEPWGRAVGINMWSTITESIDERTRRTVFLRHGSRASYGMVVEGWQVEPNLRSCMIEDLSAQAFPAYCWETPPVCLSSLDQPFEYVTVARPELQRFLADPEPFLGHFKASTPADHILTFANLSGDATLVVPRPSADHRVYAHLGVFIREAPEPQKHALFRAIGLAMRGQLSSKNTWLSTAGLGVSWLHVRLDSRPKYYNFLPYCRSS